MALWFVGAVDPCPETKAAPTRTKARPANTTATSVVDLLPGGGPSPVIHADQERSCPIKSILTMAT